MEAGLQQGHGRGRAYTLSPALYRLLGEKAEYIRQAGFGRLQHEQMVKTEHGVIARKDVVDLCRISADQAYKLLKRLSDENVITKQGLNKGARYVKT